MVRPRVPLQRHDGSPALLALFDSNTEDHTIGTATGSVAPADLLALRAALRQETEKPDALRYLARIAVIHHHVMPIAFIGGQIAGAEPFLVLHNAGSVWNVLAEHQFDLVLHGQDDPFILPLPYPNVASEGPMDLRTMIAFPIYHSRMARGWPPPWSVIGTVCFSSSSEASMTAGMCTMQPSTDILELMFTTERYSQRWCRTFWRAWRRRDAVSGRGNHARLSTQGHNVLAFRNAKCPHGLSKAVVRGVMLLRAMGWRDIACVGFASATGKNLPRRKREDHEAPRSRSSGICRHVWKFYDRITIRTLPNFADTPNARS